MRIEILLQRLRRDDFYIHRVVPLPHGQQVHLGCGIRINVYKGGSILVQGKFLEGTQAESIPLLQMILPPRTKWQVNGVSQMTMQQTPMVTDALMEKVRTAMAKR